MIKSIFTLICLFLLIISNLQAQESLLGLKIDKYLNDGVTQGFSGSVLVAKEDEIILNKGYGFADKANEIDFTSNTISTIGSVTKQFTAAAILKLVELKKLGLNDSLGKYFQNIPTDKKEITIHQLLTHSSGLIHSIGDGDFDIVSTKKFFKKLFSTKLLHQPGTKYSYSNAGYSLLARIIELVSNQEYEIFLNTHLFKPAGMSQTGYLLPNWKEKLMAKGYVHGLIDVGTMLTRYNELGEIPWSLKGNGGLLSTPMDMHKWIKALNEKNILTQASFEKLTTPYLLEQEGGNSKYGYGWVIINSDRDTKIITHNGGNAAFFHDLIWAVEEDVLILLFTNSASKEYEVAWSLEQMVFDESLSRKKIKKSPHLLVFDFIENHNLEQADILISNIKNEYSSYISSPHFLNGIGYDLLRHELNNSNIEWAIKIFEWNVKLFPMNGNNRDSLGEGYFLNGQNEKALQSYRKAIELSPPNECSWCKGSKKAIKKLNKLIAN